MDLVRRLAARAAVVEELPGGPGQADVGGGHALIAAVVVLQQEVAGGGVGKPGQGGGAAGALEGAGVDGGEVEAAQALAELAGFPDASPNDLLLEYDYGRYEGITTAEIRRQRSGWELFRDGCPGGETPAQVYARAQRFIAEAQRDGGRVLAFAHGHILRAVGAAFLEEPVEFAVRLSLDTAALSMLQDGPNGRVLGFWNLAPGQ